MKSAIISVCFFLFICFVQAQDVKINDHFVLKSDGTARLDSTATAWEDLRVTLDNGTDPTSIAYLSGSSGPQIWFSRNNGTIDAMSFMVQLPHAWKQGTTIYPHIHWIPKTTGTGNVEWNFEYSWANVNGTFPAYSTSTVTATGPFTAQTHLITALTTANAGLDGTGKTLSSVLICRIWRNASNAADTYNADAGVLYIDFHYEVDSFGSDTEYGKN